MALENAVIENTSFFRGVKNYEELCLFVKNIPDIRKGLESNTEGITAIDNNQIRGIFAN